MNTRHTHPYIIELQFKNSFINKNGSFLICCNLIQSETWMLSTAYTILCHICYENVHKKRKLCVCLRYVSTLPSSYTTTDCFEQKMLNLHHDDRQLPVYTLYRIVMRPICNELHLRDSGYINKCVVENQPCEAKYEFLISVSFFTILLLCFAIQYTKRPTTKYITQFMGMIYKNLPTKKFCRCKPNQITQMCFVCL